MKHIWTILCQKSSIDFESNLLSLFNSAEELSLTIDKSRTSPDKLIIPVELQLVSYWTIENIDKENILDIRGELLDPENKTLTTFENKFEIKKGIVRFRNRTNILSLPITKSGRYIFKMMQRKSGKSTFETVAELPLDVNISYKLLDIPKKK
jgi:hypothetical protein